MFFQNVGLYPALAIHVIILFIVTALRAWNVAIAQRVRESFTMPITHNDPHEERIGG
jgi:hypothetical protein